MQKNNPYIETLKAIPELLKIKITLAVMITTFVGYILYAGKLSSEIIIPAIGIFLLACGSSAINHFQEAKTDALMDRTRKRPIPSGRISKTLALFLIVLLIISGSVMIYAGAGVSGLILGLLALAWYNVVYTLLKKITSLAVIPGSVIGSIPPLVGWVAAGGSVFDIKAIIIALFFFVWQIPHFWLLMLKYKDDYAKAGFPVITDMFSVKSVKTLTFGWVLATVVSAWILPFFNLVNSYISIAGIGISSIWLIYIFSDLIRDQKKEFKPIYYFLKINYYILVVILFLCADHLL